MKWLKDLYVGDKAASKRKDWIRRMQRNYWVPGAYVIALAANRVDLLDIIPAYSLIQKYYTDTADLKIIGLCASWDEAMNTVIRIIGDVFDNTGGYDVQAYFEDKNYR